MTAEQRAQVVAIGRIVDEYERSHDKPSSNGEPLTDAEKEKIREIRAIIEGKQ